MRKFTLAASTIVSIAALASAANAADMAPAPSVYDWSGVYIGLNAGVAWSNSEVDGSIDCIPGSSPDACEDFDDMADDFRHGVDDSGGVFTGGAMIGANWQMESIVLGVEADVNYAGFGESNSRTIDGPDDSYWTTRAEFDADWWGTLRGRVGFAADNLLFYGTGGLAWGAMEASAGVDYCPNATCTGGTSFRGSESDTNIGWTLGAGMEYGLDQWTFGIEYLYVDLGDADFDHRGTFGSGGVTMMNPLIPVEPITRDTYRGNASVDYQFSVVRATAKWKF